MRGGAHRAPAEYQTSGRTDLPSCGTQRQSRRGADEGGPAQRPCCRASRSRRLHQSKQIRGHRWVSVRVRVFVRCENTGCVKSKAVSPGHRQPLNRGEEAYHGAAYGVVVCGVPSAHCSVPGRRAGGAGRLCGIDKAMGPSVPRGRRMGRPARQELQ